MDMGKKNSKQHNKSKNRNGTNEKNKQKLDDHKGLREDVRVVYSEESNPHDG